MANERPNVFISFKNSDENGETADKAIAETLYEKFKARGIKAFYSNITLMERGEADYTDVIEEALDAANVLILLATKAEYIESKWVKHEWRTFQNELIADEEKKRALVPVISTDIGRTQLPIAIRNNQLFTIDLLDKAVEFIDTFLVNNGIIEEVSVRMANKDALEEHSKYNSMSLKESERLRIQCELTRRSDMPAILRAVEPFKDEEKIYILDLGCAQAHTLQDRFGDFVYKNIHVVGIDRNAEVLQVARQNAPGEQFHFQEITIESDSFEENMRKYMEAEKIPGFHLITSTVFLRHLKAPLITMQRVKNLLLPGGSLMIREQDSGSIISYGDDSLIQKIFAIYNKVPGITDQQYGRRVYSQLKAAGFAQVETMHVVRDTAGITQEHRQEIFNMTFGRMENYISYLMDEADGVKDKEELGKLKKELENNLKKLYEVFMREDFWYQEEDLMFLAKF